ncbi:MAG: hypothetical protein L0Y74_11125 [candidate division Zixibacteria bacterium]|nr:hypothetical protein [candidate division Zixibacteria bacterium]
MKVYLTVLSVWLWAGICAAQFISPEIYQTEEDLLEGLQTGQLTYDQYLELLDLIQSKSDLALGDSMNTQLIPDVDYLDLDSASYDLREAMDEFLPEQLSEENEIQNRVILQHRQYISQSTQPQTYLRLESENRQSWNFNLEGDAVDGQNRIKRRSLNFFASRQWEIQLGNFQPRYGLGVNVGRRTYLNLSSDQTLESENSLLFPYLSRYNGVLVRHQTGVWNSSGFYSHNRFGKFKDQVWGGQLALDKKNLELAAILSYQSISEKESQYISRGASIHGNLKLKYLQLSSELALTGDSQKGGIVRALVSRAKKYSLQLSFWSYSRDFIHPISGGNALPDYRSVELGDLDLIFRSRQAGETGVYFFSSVWTSSQSRLELAYQQWRDGESFLNKNKARLGWGIWVRKNLEVRIKQYWEDEDLGSSSPYRNTTALVGTFLFSPTTRIQLRLYYRDEALITKSKDSAWEEVILYFPYQNWLSTKIRVRYRDPEFSAGSDSYWSFHFTELIKLNSRFSVRADFVSRNYRDDLSQDWESLKVRLEANL